tara:strand:+ start:5990 stop:6754 length:765 start_codon:yes stop_codon:yes gene_type:complete
MKKVFTLLAMVAGLSACVPYNNYYSQQPAGYYPNASYNNPYQNQQDSQASLYSHNYEQSLEMHEDRELDTIAMMQQSAIPVKEVRQQTVYQEMPQNPMYQAQQTQGLRPYYNPALVEQSSRGVVGVGQAMPGQTTKPLPVSTGYKKDGSSKLIVPNAWRMAHPSIGKGLELTNQQERLELNLALNSSTVKETKDVKLSGFPVAIIGLANSSSANSQGFLCKDVYLVKANNSGVERMWSKFCRHPNWNEWVLTAW